MNCLQRVSLLAIALSCSLDSAKAQNNFNNIEDINGANSIDEISANDGNNTDNVLDSEELNTNNSNLNATGNSNNFYENNQNGNDNLWNNNNYNLSGNSINNNNLDINYGLDESENLADTEDSGNNKDSIQSDTNSNIGTATSDSPSPDNASVSPATINSNNTTSNFSSLGATPNDAFSSENLTATDQFTSDTANAIAPPSDFAPFSQENAAPPPISEEAETFTEIPASQSNIENSAQSELARKDLEKQEKIKQKLELSRKMAEAIPPLNPGEAPPEYIVQPGDTLWDISDQLLDDAFWWPRLWVLNPEIQDPDEIEPGMRILFYPSVSGEAPSLVVQDDIDGFGSPKLDPSVLQTFSMKANRWIGKNGELVNAADLPGDQNLLTGGDMGATATYSFHLPGFMTNHEIETAGEVIANQNTPLLAGKGQSLIARFKNGAPNPGERFVAIRHRPVFSSLTDVGAQAELYNYVGVLGVVKNTSSGYTVMVPEENMAYVSPTDLLIPFNKPLIVSLAPDSAGRPNPSPGRVLATQDGTYSFAGPGMAVFLQGFDGRNPYSVGDDVELYMPLGSGLFQEEEFVGREKAATARIVETNQDTAVAVIIKANREVAAGAITTPSEN